MGLNIDIHGRIIAVAIQGELDHHQAERLRTQIDAAYEKSPCRHMVLNMESINFMDSSGIGMIIGRYKNTEKRGGRLILAGMNEHISKLFEISGLAKIVTRAANVQEALDVLGGNNGE